MSLSFCKYKDLLIFESVKLGARELRIRFAIEQYERGFMSVGRAAEIAEIGLVEFLEELRKIGVRINYDLGALIKEQIKE